MSAPIFDQVAKPVAEPGFLQVAERALVGTGLSGALVIPTLARAMGKAWMLVRKANDCETTSGGYSHGKAPLVGTLGRKWLFVDDLLMTGITLIRVTRAIELLCAQRDWQTEFMGSYEYHGPVALRQRLAVAAQRAAERVGGAHHA